MRSDDINRNIEFQAWLVILCAVGMLLIVGTAQAADDWSRTDKALAGAALGTTLMDWSQTRYIARHPDQYRELNPTLPDHPTTGQVDAHFAGSILVGGLIANWLPSDYRKWFLGGVTVFEIGTVGHNFSIGIKMGL